MFAAEGLFEVVRVPPPALDLAPRGWSQHLRLVGAPAEFPTGAGPSAFRVLVARHGGEAVATSIALDDAADRGSPTSARPMRRVGFRDLGRIIESVPAELR